MGARAALLLLLLAAAALLGGSAQAVDEVEPNDDRSTATVLEAAGSYIVDGITNNTTDTEDYFSIQLTRAAVVDVTIRWNWACSAGRCENVSALSSDGFVIISPFGNPMQGDGAYFSGVAGERFYLRVSAGSPGGPYSIDIDVYPFDYAAGATVDIRDAIDTTAVLADAYADDHLDIHPYALSYEGDGVLYGESLNLEIVNVGPLDLRIWLPAGLYWRPGDSTFTEYIVTRDFYITVPAWTYLSDRKFVAVAETPYLSVPGDPAVFGSDVIYEPDRMATSEVGRIIEVTNTGRYRYEAELIAVWAWTAGQDDRDFTGHSASQTAKDEAVEILNEADVRTSINPQASIFSFFRNFNWLLCFIVVFFVLPVLIGLIQVARAFRIRHFFIDAAYGQAARSSRRRAESRLHRMEAQRARERYREEVRAQMEHRQRVAPHVPPPPPLPYVTPPPPPPAVVVAPPPPSPAPKPVEVAPPPGPAPESPLGRFLAMDAMEKFDLDALNALDFNQVLASAVATKSMAATTGEKTGAILKRLKEDIDDPDTIDDLLRNRMVEWYRKSPTDPEWTSKATVAWWGLTAESRATSGGKRASLAHRLENLQYACESRGKWFKPKPPHVEQEKRGRGKGAEPAAVDPALLKALVVQSVLDDLAATPRGAVSTSPLPHLSELAARFSPLRVNQAFAEMFKADPRGPFVILHPSRYPDVGVTAVRPPAQAARAGAMAYDIVMQPPPGAPVQVALVVPGGTGGPPAGGALLDTSGAIWDRTDVTEQEWAAVLAEVARRRERLDPPPGGFRKLPAYFSLRKLLLSDVEACRTFNGVKWRGKPASLALLADLIREGSVTPEFQTDRDYLEAELSDIDRGDPEYRPADGKWKLDATRTVRREAAGDEFVKYSL